MKFPEKLTQGDSFSWQDDPVTDNLGRLIDNSWSLKYLIRGKASLDLTAAVEGAGWKTILSTEDSDKLEAGLNFWQAIAEKGSEKITLASGQFTVLKDFSKIADETFDGRSQIQKDLDSVQEAIRSIVSGGVQEYTINNRSFRKIDLPILRDLEVSLKSQLAKEKRSESIAQGKGDPYNIYVRFK